MTLLLLPYKDWPVADQSAWQAAICDGDVLDGRGPAVLWRPATRASNIEHYGRWLSFLARHDLLPAGTAPADRVTKDHVRTYVDELRARVAPCTVTSILVGLKVTIKAMAPDHPWRWLADICNRLNRDAQPSKDKRPKMRPTEEIVRAAVGELDRLETTSLTRRIDRVAYRDTLMLALLAYRPLRLGNFTDLRIGKSFISERSGWRIDIPGPCTKNGDPLTFDVPTCLLPYVEVYLTKVRMEFVTRASMNTNALWLGFEGQNLTAHSIYCRFILVTKRLLGTAINPHLLRDCAATTLSTVSVDDALIAAPLLGHRNFATTEKYYIRANQLEANRLMNGALADIQRDLGEIKK